VDVAHYAAQDTGSLRRREILAHSAWHVAAAIITVAAMSVGCGGSSPVPSPRVAVPATVIEAVDLLQDFIPEHPSRYDLEWTYQRQGRTTRGRAVTTFIPPDSLHFEYRAPFGRRGEAVFIGQRVIWANPEETVKTLIPATQLFWVVLGIPLPPDEVEPPRITLRADGWALQYVTGDTVLVFNHTRGSPSNLTAMLTHDGRVFGTAYVAFSDSTALPARGRMMFPGSSALFSATFEAVDRLAQVDRSLFKKP